MLEGALRSGVADRRSVFEVFARRLPEGRRYGVVAGTGRLLEALTRFVFEDDELVALERSGVVGPETLRWLAGYRFGGHVWGYGEGEVLRPGQPAAGRRGHLRRGRAARDARPVDPQPRLRDRGRREPDGRGRRTGPAWRWGHGAPTRRPRWPPPAPPTSPGSPAPATSRPAGGTASPRSGRRRTRSPCCTTTSAPPSPRRSRRLGPGTTLLVDTYDVTQGVRTAVEVAGPSSAQYAWTRATCSSRRTRCAPSSTGSAPTDPASS